MKKQVMKPFRAPRKTGDKTQETVHRKDNAGKTYRNVRRHKDKQARQQPPADSEESTELGLVWPQPEVQVVAEQTSNPWWPGEPSNEKVVTEEHCNAKSVIEEESLRLTDYESEGFISRRASRQTSQKCSEGFKLLALARQKQQQELALIKAKADFQAKDKILRKAQSELEKEKRERDKMQLEENTSSDDDEDNVPFSASMQQKSKTTSDDENDNVPIVALVQKQSPATSKTLSLPFSYPKPNPLPSPSDPKAKRLKETPRPRWVYEPIVSVASPYWDVLAIDTIPEHIALDEENDNVSIVALAGHKKLDVLATFTSGAASIVYPKGAAAIGVEVARDFGGTFGICSGKIVSVDLVTRRPLYHVIYTDGDEEDYDDGKLQYAIDLHFAVKTGLALPVPINEDNDMLHISIVILTLEFNLKFYYRQRKR
jgi:hypothetical protein